MPDRRLLEAIAIALGFSVFGVALGLVGFFTAWAINAGF